MNRKITLKYFLFTVLFLALLALGGVIGYLSDPNPGSHSVVPTEIAYPQVDPVPDNAAHGIDFLGVWHILFP